MLFFGWCLLLPLLLPLVTAKQKCSVFFFGGVLKTSVLNKISGSLVRRNDTTTCFKQRTRYEFVCLFFFLKKKTAQQEALCCWYPWVLNGTTACCEELTALDFFVVVLGHTKRSLCQQPMLTHTWQARPLNELCILILSCWQPRRRVMGDCGRATWLSKLNWVTWGD